MRVTLSWRLAGGLLVLTATTPNRSESCHDSWSVSPSLALTSEPAAVASTPPAGVLISRASVPVSSLAPDTTYTFSYAIVIGAGERAAAGSASATVTVDADGWPVPCPDPGPRDGCGVRRR